MKTACRIVSRWKGGAKINSFVFTTLLALYFAIILNIPITCTIIKILNKLVSVKIGFILSIPVLLIAALNFFFTLCSIKYFEKAFFIIVILISAIESYAMYYYGVLFDSDMMVNIFQSNNAEMLSYLNPAIFVWFILLGVVPAVIVAKLNIVHLSLYKDIGTKIIAALLSLFVIVIIALLYYQDYASVKRNNSSLNKMIIPIHWIYSTGKYINKTYFTTPPSYKQLGLDAKNTADHKQHKNSLLLVVVGETARSMNYQINGYNKATNKHTQGLDLISFKNVTSCGTNTAVSVPCMFSKLDRENYTASKAEYQDTLLDVLKHSGINVLWVDNNAGCYKVCKNVATITTDVNNRKWCDGHTCVDEALLVDLQKQIDAFHGQDSVIFLHAIGSHGPNYYKRFPKQHSYFKPGCLRSDIQNCTSEELLNTYDNSILYTDFILQKIIKILGKNNDNWHTAIIYLSDHGESLGEKGLYLHGFPYNIAPIEQTHIPYITWFSASFIANKKLDIACLKQQADTATHSHDNVFSSILGLMDIATKEYSKQDDVFAPCRKKK